jgi:hypothetical protein
VLGRELGSGVGREELRTAFRRRALELHPDRAAALGRDAAALADEFRALCEAFEALEQLATGDERAAAVERTRSPRRAAGTLPPRPLRFAEYLYYAGRISWADLAEAIAWQRHAGRRIGQWFVERGLIGPGEVRGVREALARHNSAGGRQIPTM